MEQQNTSRRWRRVLALIVIGLAVAAALSVAAVFGAWELAAWYTVQQYESTPRIHLSRDAYSDETDVQLTAEELESFTSPYSELRSSMLYESLSQNERYVYRAMEYALYNSYSYVCVDGAWADDREVLIKALRCLSLDSPLLEQNLKYATSDFSFVYAVDVLGLAERDATLSGYYIRVDNFQQAQWERKLTALEHAKTLVGKLSPTLSAEDKAEQLYKMVATGAEYYDYPSAGDKKVHSYLYDALLGGKTNCDGYANALALVYRLAQIECVEKNYIPDTPDEDGHTWVFFELNGSWYNADATGDSLVPKRTPQMRGGFYYAFADVLQTDTPRYAEVYPVCERSLYMPIDAHLKNTTGETFVNAVLDGIDAHNGSWTVILVDSVQKDTLRSQMQKVANTVHCTVTRRLISVIDGRTAVLVYTQL